MIKNLNVLLSAKKFDIKAAEAMLMEVFICVHT